MDGLIPREEFIGITSVAHLAAGGEAPVLRSHLGAAAQFLLDKGDGMPGRDRMFVVVERTKAALASLLGRRASEIALLANASEGLFIAASGIEWRPGDNVVVERAEFPSVFHAWHGPRSPGVEVRVVGEGLVPSIEEVRAATDNRTRVIAISQVSFLTGARHALATLRAVADAVGARLVVDASHALGVVPVEGALCDVVVSCAYKWLLGIHGVGVLYVNSERWPDLCPPWLGWHSIEAEGDWCHRGGYRLKETVERFEIGNPSFISVYILDNALRRLAAVGIDRIEPHVLDLGGTVREGLVKLGLPVLTPEPASERAGNIAFAAERPLELEGRFRSKGIITWAGDGRVRLSVHLYNGEDDVERALKALKECMA